MTSNVQIISPFFNGAPELARYLGLDPVTIRRLVRRKALPYIRVGGRYLFRRCEVEAFLQRHSVGAIGMRQSGKNAPRAVGACEEGLCGDEASQTRIITHRRDELKPGFGEGGEG